MVGCQIHGGVLVSKVVERVYLALGEEWEARSRCRHRGRNQCVSYEWGHCAVLLHDGVLQVSAFLEYADAMEFTLSLSVRHCRLACCLLSDLVTVDPFHVQGVF